jgi:hypothetical protein
MRSPKGCFLVLLRTTIAFAATYQRRRKSNRGNGSAGGFAALQQPQQQLNQNATVTG